MTKANTNNGMKQNQMFFYETCSYSDNIFFYPKILKYFNGFQNRNFSVL